MSNQIIPSYIPPSFHQKHDVFLSFRGDDTRNNFTSHLYDALKQKGIGVFRDDDGIERGKFISQELLQAIEESRFSVVVLSKNYASSSWCLDELVKIVDCMEKKGQTIIPIFYHVDPSMVRYQRGGFGRAFSKHEQTFKENIGKVQAWRSALTKVANISGWDVKDRFESEFIEEIVDKISNKIVLSTWMNLKDLVGINSRMEKLRMLIDAGSSSVRMIGICGIGGIGKTTIAKVIYCSMSSEFEGSSFLSNVREIAEKGDIISLQKQLLSQILRKTNISIWDDNSGINEIIKRLRYKKVLIVIDDVAHRGQLNKLAGAHDWFGPGSRIIITTRDESLLLLHGVEVYKAEELNDADALQLFSLKAFKNYKPPDDYLEISNRVIKYASGLPLALEVLGSFLFCRTVDEWEDALNRLHKDSAKEIMDRLQISFDGLEETEKNIFLDVACFFKGKNKDYVTKILGACGLNPIIGINVLIDRSLITISMANTLQMHDLLQEMGKQIVRRESLKEPGKRSRLWEENDIRHVLTNITGTEVVQGIMIDCFEGYVHCSANAFSKMTNLRLLKIRNVQLFEGHLDYLSNKLRLLDWKGYPLKSIPSNLQLDNVVELKLDYSRIEQLWTEIKLLNMLTSINLKGCQYLNKTPDLKCARNLKMVILEGCKKLCEVHPSLLLHENIRVLDMRSCTSLTTLPNKIHMKKLEKLWLSSCSKLKKFPEIVDSMDCLWTLDLSNTAIKELPSSIELLSGLVCLYLTDCKNLVSLSITINALKSLKELKLGSCSKLENLFETLGQVENLAMLEGCGTGIRQPISSIILSKSLYESDFCGFKRPPPSPSTLHSLISVMKKSSNSMPSRFLSLERLNLSDCNLGEKAIPSDFFGSFPSLRKLWLSKNNFVYLPGSISHLLKLKDLYLEGCMRLQSLPELPSKIESVNVNDCASLETLSNALSLCNLELSKVSCVNCFKLVGCNSMAFSMLTEHLNKAVPNLRDKYDIHKAMYRVFMNKFSMVVPGSEIPEWLSHQSECSSIRIDRPPYFCCSKLLGFVVGCVFGVQEYPAVSWNSYHEVRCITKDVRKCKVVLARIYIGKRFGQALLDHLWLLYFPRQKIEKNSFGQNHMEFSFEGVSALEVKMCGVHPVYEEDVDEFNKMDNKSRFWNVNESHQDLFGLTKRSPVAYCNNGNFCYDELPQTERFTQILLKGVQGLWA